ncbi:hypothetical protein Ahia01_000366900 [Argonauta hians]
MFELGGGADKDATAYATAVKRTTDFVQCNIKNAAQLLRDAREKITIAENGEFKMKDSKLHETRERMVTYTSISNKTKKPTTLTQKEIKSIFQKNITYIQRGRKYCTLHRHVKDSATAQEMAVDPISEAGYTLQPTYIGKRSQKLVVTNIPPHINKRCILLGLLDPEEDVLFKVGKASTDIYSGTSIEVLVQMTPKRISKMPGWHIGNSNIRTRKTTIVPRM